MVGGTIDQGSRILAHRALKNLLINVYEYMIPESRASDNTLGQKFLYFKLCETPTRTGFQVLEVDLFT